MKKILVGIFGLVFALCLVATISAAACQNNQGYYEKCRGEGYTNYDGYHPYYDYDRYALNDRAVVPIFKGSYGNYRYEQYINGDTNPVRYFVSSGISYPRPFYGGYGSFGYGGYYGYRGYYGGYGYPLTFSYY